MELNLPIKQGERPLFKALELLKIFIEIIKEIRMFMKPLKVKQFLIG